MINENISNRKKYLKYYQDHPLECQPYLSLDRIVYITKIYKLEKNRIILFKLSNDHIQAFRYEKDLYLVITELEVVMIEI